MRTAFYRLMSQGRSRAALLGLAAAVVAAPAVLARPPVAVTAAVEAPAVRAPSRDREVRALLSQRPAPTFDRAAALLETERDPAARRRLVSWLAERVSSERRALFERLAEADRDPQVISTAVGALAALTSASLTRMLDRRLAEARAAGDEARVAALLPEQERWLLFRDGVALPAFLREPGPVFDAAPRDEPARVVVMGDFGNGSASQRRVAAAMAAFHDRQPFTVGITVGDNFYPDGLDSPDHPRWESQWERLYTPLGVRFYATLGNHDWHHPSAAAAEILRSTRSPSWRLPAPYYSFRAGPAHFFAIDTDRVSEAQLAWLSAGLERSDARWKIVFGHHPLYSVGRHGGNAALAARLMPILRDRADLYLCGHEHSLQHLRSGGRLELFVVGGGGATAGPVADSPRAVWTRSGHGFAVVDVGPEALRVRFVDDDAQVLHDVTRKPHRREGLTQRSERR